MRLARRALPLVAFAITSHGVHAQGPRLEDADRKVGIARKGEALIGSGAPADRAGAGLNGSAIQLNAQNGETEASVAMTFGLVRYSPRLIENGIYRLSSLGLVFTGTTPLDEKDKAFTKLFSGDSLVTGTRLKAALTFTTMKQKDGVEATPNHIELSRSCMRQVLLTWANGDPDKSEEAGRYLAEIARLPTDDLAEYGKAVRQTLTAQKNVADAASEANTKCWNGKSPADLKDYADDETYEAFVRAAYVDSPMFFAGLDASVGKDTYKSLDRANFNIDEVKRTSWETGAYLGLVGPTLNWSLRARAVYGKKYEAAKQAEICREAEGAVEPECISGPDGQPVGIKTKLASVEGRYRTTVVGGQEIAFAPQVTYNFDEDVLGVEVPVYLSPDEEGILSGGLKFGYTSKDDDFAIGVFVGVPFSILY